jgi:hypothetical protein
MSIYESIAQIMNEVGAIPKSKKNTQGNGFMYRGVDDVMNALQPLLAKYKVFVVPEVLEQSREERQTKSGGNLIYTILRVKYVFYAEDGTNVSATVAGEAMDSGDKSSNKAMSAAFKYALFQTFCIPTEEMRDPDADTYEVTAKAPICADCGNGIKAYKTVSAATMAAKSREKYGRPLCADCAAKAKAAAEKAAT